MSRWFRFYEEALDDPKVQQLPGGEFKSWVNLLCIASKRGGTLPPLSDLAFCLRLTVPAATKIVNKFKALELIDEVDSVLVPHNWNKRQYKSDVSNERVKRYRERQRNGRCNVTGNGSVAPPEADTEADKNSGGGATPLQRAMQVTNKLAVMCGYDPEIIPPSWCGDPQRVQVWMENGWTEEIILSVAEGMLKSHDKTDPIGSVRFFEKRIAKTIAQANKPLPKHEATNGYKRNGSVGKIDGFDKLEWELERQLAERQPGIGSQVAYRASSPPLQILYQRKD